MIEKSLVPENEARTLYETLKDDLPDGQTFEDFESEFDDFSIIWEEDERILEARLQELFVCTECGDKHQNFDKDLSKSTHLEPICKYCTGDLVNHCKNCNAEDCQCCSYNPRF